MKINTKIRYGVRTMIELALNKSGEGILQKDISKNQDISYKYLDQIIAGLKSSGLAANVAGRKSGYRLAREPAKITVYDVFSAFSPEFAVVDCLADERIGQKPDHCAARDFWYGLNTVLAEYLKSTTIADLANKQVELNHRKQELTFHI